MSDTFYDNFTHFVKPDEPVREKLFFNLHIHTLHEESSYYLVFFQGDNQAYIAGRVLPGDTLIGAISKELKADFGINEWEFFGNTLFSDIARDNKGEKVKRMDVYVNVPYFAVGDRRIAGMSMKWQLVSNEGTVEDSPEPYVSQPGTFPFKEQLPDPSPAVKAILDETEDILNRSRETTIEKLAPYVSREPKAGEVFAYFELFLYQNYGMNYNTVFLEDKRLDYDYDFIAQGESFLPRLYEYSETNEAYAYFMDHLSQDDGSVYSQLLEKMLFEWFTDCWFRAGGEKSKIPTFFSFEKEYRVRDMSTGELMKESEAASRILGYAVS